MMYKFLSAIFTIGILISCQGNKLPIDSPRPVVDSLLSRKIENDLEQAYQKQSLALLDTVLMEWFKSIKPKDINSIDNPLERDLYEIFKLVYQPDDLLKINDSDEPLYSTESDYIIVQTQLQYLPDFEVYPDSIYADSLFVVHDFRPAITNSKSKKVLYLTKEYELAIKHFLNPDNSRLMTHYGRSKFLRNRLNILLSHNANFWYLETHPLINGISFDPGYQFACAGYELSYSIWFADLEKANNQWVIKKVECGGIE
ncbi:MAG: hypothetical protein N4A71_03205 [Carboxylicivirga sp.]|nr:hypothetical protein [Carboxylicivirga sp.]MCT4646468.1 hypothetical protein [Carboxylicivirga sp.]